MYINYFKFLNELFNLFTTQEKKYFFKIQIIIIIMAFIEVLSIASIAPLMSVVSNLETIKSNAYLFKAYSILNFNDPNNFVYFIGLCSFFAIFISSLFSIFAIWQLAKFNSSINAQFANRLYSYFMGRSWNFHISKSSSELVQKIASESGRVTSGIISPLMRIISKIILTIFMLGLLFAVNFQVTFIILVSFAIIYSCVYFLTKKKLYNNGKKISNSNLNRFKLMTNGFNSIKELIILNRQNKLIEEFNEYGNTLAKSNALNQSYGQVPKYVIEFVAFAIAIFIVIFFFSILDGNIDEVLPIISLFIVSGFKLLPAFQQSYSGIASIRSNRPAFENIKYFLSQSKRSFKNQQNTNLKNINDIKTINLSNIRFKYNQEKNILDNINFKINEGEFIGLVGKTGSGKTTIIDILAGLHKPTDGKIKINNIDLNDINILDWRNKISYLSQSTYLVDGNFIDNIAFGIPDNEINHDQIKKAIEMSEMGEFVNSLDNGIFSNLGENGVKLSGGQIQRIGIARALYKNTKILLFDEPTSALDSTTERKIINNIRTNLKDITFIIITHRILTLKNCNKIFLLEDGKIINNGTFDYLNNNDKIFNQMIKEQEDGF